MAWMRAMEKRRARQQARMERARARQEAKERRQAKERPRGALFYAAVSLSLVLLLVLGFLIHREWQEHWRQVQIRINGQTYSLRVDEPLQQLLQQEGSFGQHPGNLLDIEGQILEAGAGEPLGVQVNGQPSSLEALGRLRAGQVQTVEIRSGQDKTEEHEVEAQAVPHGIYIDLTQGAIQIRSVDGQDGRKEVWRGKRSGKTLDKGLVQEPVKTQVSSFSAHIKSKKVIALTFDDGPSRYTPTYLDILKEKGVKATFFNVGENVENLPELHRRVVEEGHQMAGHSYNHPDMTSLSKEKKRKNIMDGFDAIEKASGVKTRVLRAPYGAFGLQEWKDTADFLKMNVLWDIDTEDWKKPGAKKIEERVLNGAFSGAIVLMHDGGGEREQDIEALPHIIDGLKAEGYSFVTIDELIKLHEAEEG